MNRIFKLYVFLIIFVLVSFRSLYSCVSPSYNGTELIKFRQTESPAGVPVAYHYVQIAPEGKNKNTPVIIALDPGGNGELAVTKFLPAATKYSCLIIGLDNVWNNQSDSEKRIEAVLSDVKRQFELTDNKIIYAGFSGGARLALIYCHRHSGDGVIMAGAGPGNMQLINVPFPLVTLTGTKDFNFFEHYYPPQSAVFKNNKILTIVFSGKHMWPDPALLTDAVNFILLKTGTIKAEKEKSSTAIIQLTDSLINAGEYLFALKEIEKALKLKNQDRSVIQQKLSELLSTEKCQLYFVDLEAGLKAEIDRQNLLVQALDTKDKIWWKNELIKIDQKIQSPDNLLTADSYARTRSLLGIMFFSVINYMIGNAPNEQVSKLLDIYELAEPINPYVFYFKAVIAFQNNKTEESLKLLQQSKDLGFSDTIRLHADFPTEFYQKVYE